jgi:hypothetical protein
MLLNPLLPALEHHTTFFLEKAKIGELNTDAKPTVP